MKRKTSSGGRAASSTKPSQPTVSPIALLASQEGSKGNINNDINAGSNISLHDNLGDDYICKDLLDRRICTSCNEDGEVLVCAERDCPVTLHAKCLCTEPKFDDRGKFYCPYCWYKRALAEAQEFRNKALLAKSDLSKFFCQIVVSSDKLAQNDVEAKRKELKGFSVVGNGNGFDRHDGQGNDSACSQLLKTVQDQQKDVESLMAGTDQDGIAFKDEAHPNVPGANSSDSRHYREEEGRVKDRKKFVQNELEVSATDCSVSETNNSDYEPLSMKKSRVKQWTQETAYSQRVPSVKAISLKSNNGGKNACYKNEEVAISETLRLPQRSSMRGCSRKPTLQTGKRKRLNWTAEEENMLKEGVIMFGMEHRCIPWRKILQFGSRVFDGNRTAGDLKDKWKNMKA